MYCLSHCVREAIHTGLGIPLGRGVGTGVRPEPAAGEDSDQESVGEEVAVEAHVIN